MTSRLCRGTIHRALFALAPRPSTWRERDYQARRALFEQALPA